MKFVYEKISSCAGDIRAVMNTNTIRVYICGGLNAILKRAQRKNILD